MSNYQEVGGLASSVRENAPSAEYDEIDLIDVIGFFWRSRFIVGSCLVLGVCGAAVLWFTNKAADPRAVQTLQWTLELPARGGDEAALSGVPLQLNNYLKTPAGARSFYEALARVSGESVFPIEEWVAKQQVGQGLIKSLEIQGDHIAVTFESKAQWTELDVKSFVPEALNASISSFNTSFSRVQSALSQESLELQLKLGEIKLKALKLFDRYSGLSPGFQKGVIEGLMKELAETSRPDAIAFLLSAVPANDPEKMELLGTYKKYYLAYETLEKQSKSLAKTLNLETVAPLTALGPATSATASTSLSGTGLAHRLAQKLPVLLALGLVLGGMLGTFLALLRAFWVSNRLRLTEVFKEKR